MNNQPYALPPLNAWLLRAGLLILATTLSMVGLWALTLPRSFYDSFPSPGWLWVSTLGPYNEHLVRDYGAMSLALGFLMASAAISLERRLTRVALCTLLVFAAPHFAFHTTQTSHFPHFHNVSQLGGLGFQVLLPLVLLALTTTRSLGASQRARRGEALKG